MRKVLCFLLLTIILACGDGVNMVKPVFIEDLHQHTIELGHSHPIDNLDHSHSDDDLIEELLQKRFGDAYAQQPIVSSNPFSRIITDSQEILAMDGGEDLLNVAIGKGSPEQKLQRILTMRNSEAKRQLIQAYVEHGDWITQMAQRLGVKGF